MVKLTKDVAVVKSEEKIELPLEARERFVGYCIAWNPPKKIGLVLDEDSNQQYEVKAENILAVDDQNNRLHCLEKVEFSLIPDDDDELQACYVTKPGLKRIQHIWRSSQRRGKEAPVTEARHIGYVEKYEKKHHGFIVFKTENFRNIYFPEKELQTTGEKMILEGSEIEFDVRLKDGKTQAQNITRPGGGLITYETDILGKMLRETCIKLENKKALEPNAEVRVRGIVGVWHGRDERGILWPLDGSLRIHCKAEDITSTGFKMLQPQTEVEFSVVKENNDLKAKNVTGPNGDPYIDAELGPVFDHFVRLKKSFEEKEVLNFDPEARVTGWVKYLTNHDEFGYIEPNHPDGKKHVEFTYHQIAWKGPGFPHVKVNEPVEFSTCSWDDGTVRAIRVTKPGGEYFRLSEQELKDYEEMKKNAARAQNQQNPQNVEMKEKEDVETKAEPVKPVANVVPEEFVDLPARERKDGCETLIGVVVDYNLPSLKGILQPLGGPEGGEHKELLQFDVGELQCEGFRGVKKWQKVEFSRVEKDRHSRAVHVTAIGNKLINFNEKDLLQRERWLIQAHRQRMMKRTAENPAARKQNTRTWMGNVMPFPIGMPPFPPPMMAMPPFPPMMDMPHPPYMGDHFNPYFHPMPYPGFQQFMPY